MKQKVTTIACAAFLTGLLAGCDTGPKIIEENVLDVKIHEPVMIEVKGLTKEITILSMEGNEGKCEIAQKDQIGRAYFPKKVVWNQTVWFRYKYCDLETLFIETDQGIVALGI